MEPNLEQLIQQFEELKTQIKDLRVFAEAQQDSITSLIALSQQQTTVIEQQNAVIQHLVSK